MTEAAIRPSVQIQRLIDRHPQVFDPDVSYEAEDGIWVYLNGYSIDEVHNIHEWNVADVLVEMRALIRSLAEHKCDCSQCQAYHAGYAIRTDDEDTDSPFIRSLPL
jgi:hypothetical protein